MMEVTRTELELEYL